MKNKHDKPFGKRCATKDIEDFPDLTSDERCMNCLIWEKIDSEIEKATQKYQTEYEQKHIANAVRLAKKEQTQKEIK